MRTRKEGTFTICLPTRMWRCDQHARVVHRLGEAELEHEGLQALKERVRGEREHVIELVLGLVLLEVGVGVGWSAPRIELQGYFPRLDPSQGRCRSRFVTDGPPTSTPETRDAWV